MKKIILSLMVVVVLFGGFVVPQVEAIMDPCTHFESGSTEYQNCWRDDIQNERRSKTGGANFLKALISLGGLISFVIFSLQFLKHIKKKNSRKKSIRKIINVSIAALVALYFMKDLKGVIELFQHFS